MMILYNNTNSMKIAYKCIDIMILLSPDLFIIFSTVRMK